MFDLYFAQSQVQSDSQQLFDPLSRYIDYPSQKAGFRVDNVKIMQNYQLFWNDQISKEGQGQLVVDWDLFIRSFVEAILRHTHYQLNSIQKEFIKGKIDPLNTNQIYKNAFLLFAKNYWNLPSNRTNLFKMKMNLSTIPRLNLMVGSDHQTITLKFKWNDQQKHTRELHYFYKQNKLYELDAKGFEISQKSVLQSGFISLGSSQKNDVVISDCLFLNKHHFKLTNLRKEVKVKKKSIFQQKQPAPLILTEWFIRDTAKSNRVSYQLDNAYKYVIVKPGMVINFGFANNYELRVLKVGFNAGNIQIPSKTIDQMSSVLNTDRINFMGQIDPKIPLKTVIDFDFKEVNPKQIQQLYLQGEYYPNNRDEDYGKKGIADKNVASIVFQIFNKRNFKEQLANSGNQNVFTFGRSQQCNYRLEDICVRNKQLIFQCINGVWTVRNAQKQANITLDRDFCGINLASLKNIEERRNSNRIQLKQGYPYVIRGKQFQCEIQLKQAKNDQPDF